jgi:hypothetical protein
MFFPKYKKILIFILFLSSAGAILGYDNLIIHPSLTRAALEVYNREGDIKINSEQAIWIIAGSIAEDADPRYINHFYNPETGQGLGAYDYIMGRKVWLAGASAKDWSKNQNSASGDYSIGATLENYRNKNFRRAYEGIGHILHLIQDMSVPAHTRNDPHAAGDPYEGWAQKYGSVSGNVASAGALTSVDEAFDAVASYSHYNFFSKDTISGVAKREVKRLEISDTTAYIYCRDNKGHVFTCVKEVKTPLLAYYVDDNTVNKDYWDLLSPEAVSYSASVINYFAEEFKKIDQEEKKPKEDLSLWEKIKSSVSQVAEDAKYVWGDAVIIGGVKAQEVVVVAKSLTPSFESLVSVPYVKDDSQGKVLSSTASATDNPADSAVKEIVSDQGQVALNNIPVIKNDTPIVAVKNSVAPADNPLVQVISGKIVAPDSVAKVLDLIINNQIKNSSDLIPELKPDSNVVKENPANKNTTITPAPLLPGGASAVMDNIPPDTTILSGPATITSSTVASFVFTASETEKRFEYNFNSAGWNNTTANLTLSSLADGAYSILARAVDLSDNVDLSPASSNWTIDTIAPLASFISTTSAFSNATTTVFGLAANEAGVSFSCNLDAGAWQSCGATTTINSLSETAHTLEIKSTDLAGNTGTSTAFSWAVDITAPTSSVAVAATSTAGSTFNVGWLGGDDNGNIHSGIDSYDVEYQINAGAWQSWVSASSSTSTIYNLATTVGDTINFHSRARDLAGNVSDWSGSSPVAIVTTNLTTNLEHLWHFDDCEGATVVDMQGGDTLAMGGSYWTVGKFGCGLRHNIPVSGNYSTATFASSINSSSYTLSYYWRSTDCWNDHTRSGCYSMTGIYYDHTFLKDASNNIMVGTQYSSKGTATFYCNGLTTTSTDVPADANWHLVTLSCSPTAMNYYYDGVLKKQVLGNYSPAQPITKIEIANEDWNDEEIDEMGIWTRALGASEISDYYVSNTYLLPFTARLAQTPATKVHFWNFNEGAGIVATDNIGGDNLDIAGSSLWVPGHLGVDSGMEYSGPLTTNKTFAIPINSKDLSLGFWMRYNAGEWYSTSGIKVTLKNASNVDILSINGSYYMDSTCFLPDIIYKSTATNKLGPAWHYYTLVYDSYAYKIYYYVDGVQTRNISMPWFRGVAVSMVIQGLAANYDLDDISVWQGALTPAEVLTAYGQ